LTFSDFSDFSDFFSRFQTEGSANEMHNNNKNLLQFFLKQAKRKDRMKKISDVFFHTFMFYVVDDIIINHFLPVNR
jgi:hypothetical protein